MRATHYTGTERSSVETEAVRFGLLFIDLSNEVLGTDGAQTENQVLYRTTAYRLEGGQSEQVYLRGQVKKSDTYY